MREFIGELEGAPYRIAIPDPWNGKLILWAKGWKATGSQGLEHNPVVDGPFGRDFLAENGYAWAASAFNPKHFVPANSHSFVPVEAAADLAALMDHFTEQVEIPDTTYVGGLSMGGNVALLSLEGPHRYDGGLAFCSAAGLLTLDYEGHTFVLGAYAAGLTQNDYESTDIKTLCRDHIIPKLKSDKVAGDLFVKLYVENTGGNRPFADEIGTDVFSSSTYFGPVGIEQGAFDNREYRYISPEGIDAEKLNGSVVRITGNPEIRNKKPDFKIPTGKISAPLLMVHTTGDTSTPISVLSKYRSICEKGDTSPLLVQRAMRAKRHCQFSGKEKAASWQALFDWVEREVVPDGDNLLGTLEDIGQKFTLSD